MHPQSIIRTIRIAVYTFSLMAYALPAYGQFNQCPALSGKRSEVTTKDNSGLGQVEFVGLSNVDGVATLTLRPTLRSTRATVTAISRDLRRRIRIRSGEPIRATWQVRVHGNGYHQLFAIESHVDVADSSIQTQYSVDASTPLYATLAESRAIKSSSCIDPTYLVAPAEIGTSTNAHRGRPIQVGELKEPWEQVTAQGTTTVTVNITGRVAYSETAGLTKGIPGLKIWLDWDDDLNPATVLPSPYTPIVTATTGFDGRYSFHFTFQADRPIREYASWLRVSAETCNDAARGNILGCGGRFPDLEEISIQSAEYDITSTIPDISVDDRDQAAALRHLYRARYASSVLLNMVPPQIVYFYDDTEQRSFFSKGDAWAGRGYPHIVFNDYAHAGRAYHEYGHYVEYTADYDMLSNDCNGEHWFRRHTAPNCAWNEGWAEAFDALAHMLFYTVENPTRIENNHFGEGTDPVIPEGVYQFLDFSEQHLFPDRPGREVEGAVACFFHGLFDNPELRAPGYTGDNDDLGDPYGYPGSDIHRLLPYRDQTSNAPVYNYMWLGLIPWMKKYYSTTWVYHSLSTYAHFRHVVDHVGVQRPATPTRLQATVQQAGPIGPYFVRLTWNDNTEPGSVTYTCEDGSVNTYDLAENNEDGFVIWRRALPAGRTRWDEHDGRFNASYMRVGVVGRDVTTWSDPTPLPRGTYRYVVTAYNQGNLDTASIPKAEVTVSLNGKIPDILSDGTYPSIKLLYPGQTLRLNVGTPAVNPTFHWIAENKPPYISLSGIDSSVLSIMNTFQHGVDSVDLLLFNVRCVVTDVFGPDTSAPYYPPYVPMDRASMILDVVDNGTMRPDTALHGLPFVSQIFEYPTSTHALSVRPSKDSGAYRLRFHGVKRGTLHLDYMTLYYVDHPADVAIGGDQTDGFYAYRMVGNQMIIDSNDAYLVFNDLPLLTARETGGAEQAPLLRTIDFVRYPMESTDTMLAVFQYLPPGRPLWDTAARGRTRSFVLELRGNYAEDEGGPSTSTVAINAGSSGISLGECFPNPASGTITIPLALERAARVRLSLFDERGNTIATITDGNYSAGRHSIPWKTGTLASGRYYIVLSAGTTSASRAITILR